MPNIELRTLINAPVGLCFDLSRNIDMHISSMQKHHEQAVAGIVQGPIALCDTVTWQARHFGVLFKMTVKITEMQPCQYFVDEMQSGPFKWFRHYHGFQAQGDHTLMTDEFVYRSPLGWLGKMADRLFLKNYMQQLLEERNTLIKQVAESFSEPAFTGLKN